MKHLLFLVLFASVNVFAAGMSHKEYAGLSLKQQMEVLKAYKEFLSKNHHQLDKHEQKKSAFWSPIQNAYAEGDNYNCFYAGWPSVKRPSGSRSLCSTPANGNSDYNQGNCPANSLQCQPLLFGEGLCARTGTRQLRNTAFAQCENQFRENGGGLAALAAGLAAPEKANKVQELFSTVERICGSDAPAICGALQRRVAEIKQERDTVVARAAGGTVDVQANGEEVRDPAQAQEIVEAAQSADRAGQQVADATLIDCDLDHDHSQDQPRAPSGTAVRQEPRPQYHSEQARQEGERRLAQVFDGPIQIEHTHPDQRNCPNPAQIKAIKATIGKATLSGLAPYCHSAWENHQGLRQYAETHPQLRGKPYDRTISESFFAIVTNRSYGIGHQTTTINYFKGFFGARPGGAAFDAIQSHHLYNSQNEVQRDPAGFCQKQGDLFVRVMSAQSDADFEWALTSVVAANTSASWNEALKKVREEKGLGNCQIPNTAEAQ